MPTITFPSVTRTSVTISFIQPEGSLLADNYTVFLMQILDSDQPCVKCQNMTNTTNRNTIMISTLREQSTFNVTVIARKFDESVISMEQFDTPDISAGKTIKMMTDFFLRIY